MDQFFVRIRNGRRWRPKQRYGRTRSINPKFMASWRDEDDDAVAGQEVLQQTTGLQPMQDLATGLQAFYRS